MAAGLLALHGAFMGCTLPPGRHNPKGYWENIGVNEVNETFLARLGIAWDWPFDMPAARPEELAATNNAFAQALEPFQGQNFWALKDPRLCRLLPIRRPLLERLGSLRGLVVFRHPESACRSLQQRGNMSRRQAMALWLHHFTDAVRHLADIPWVALNYEHLLTEPREDMKRLAEQLNFRWPRIPDEGELRDFVDPSLFHHRPAPPQSTDWIETRAYEFYALLAERHLQQPDTAFTGYTAALHAELAGGRGMHMDLVREIYGELVRLRARQHAAPAGGQAG